jgi:hypothetical protein
MTPFELESLIDEHGVALERWPDAERAAARVLLAGSEAAREALRRAERLEAILGAPTDGDIDPDHVLRVIARTGAAARRTPQVPPPLPVRLRRWCAGLFPSADDGLWRYGVPVAIGLILGVVVGQVSVDQVAYGDTSGDTTPNIASLIATPHASEPFGL